MPKANPPDTTPRPPRLQPRPGLTTGNVAYLAFEAVPDPETELLEMLRELKAVWAEVRRRKPLTAGRKP